MPDSKAIISAVGKRERKLLVTHKGVLVKVPAESALNFKYIPRKHFPAQNGKPAVEIEAHYRHGYLAGNKPIVIVFRHFYGLPADKFGKTIIATVKVFKKMVPDKYNPGQFLAYIFEDIIYTPDEPVSLEHKFLHDPKNRCGGIIIPRTEEVIYFRPIKK